MAFVAKSRLMLATELMRSLLPLALKIRLVAPTPLRGPDRATPLISTLPLFVALMVLPAPLASVPTRVRVLPAPSATSLPMLVMVLLRASVPPAVASAVPLLTKLLLFCVSAPPVALISPLLVRIEPDPDSEILPKPTSLPLPPMIKLSPEV